MINLKKMDKMAKLPEHTAVQEQEIERVKSCQNYYQIFDVSTDATQSDIKKAYKKLILNLHPDKNKHPDSTEVFRSTVKAMCVLSDPEKRKHYDIKLGIKLTNFDIKDTIEICTKRGPVPKQQEKRRAHTNNDNIQYSELSHWLLTLMPIVLPLIKIDPAYRFRLSSEYVISRVTQNLNILYFVKDNFNEEDQESVKSVEKRVEANYMLGIKTVIKILSVLYCN